MVRPRFICLALVLVTTLVYLPVHRHGFLVFDDNLYVTENHVVQEGLTVQGTRWAFTTLHASNWHPVTWLSHMTDCELFGLDAAAQHFVNVLFHGVNALLLFLLLLRLTQRLWPAAFVAALFAWHPLHVESVAWIAERKDVLSTLFALLTLWFYAGYAAGGKNKARDCLLALVCFALGLMAKPMLVTLPFVMLLLDWWPLGRVPASAAKPETRNPKRASLLLEKLPFFLLTLASCVVTFIAQRTEAVLTFEQHPFALRLGNALVAYAQYLWKTLWPAKLAVLYPLPAQLPAGQVAAATIVLAGISWFAWRGRRERPYLLVGWLWYLGMLVPVIGLVQVGGQAMADRYTYLPLIGIFIAIAYGAADLIARRRMKPALVSAAALVVLAGNIAATEWHLRFWKDSESLFTRALAVTGYNAVAHINLGVALEQQGRREAALAEYRSALRIDPKHAQAHNNLANLLAELGQRDEALAEYGEALRLNPGAPLAHANLGTLLAELGRFDEAMDEFTEAARLAPEDPRPHYLMGKATLRRGQSAEATGHLRNALRLNPNEVQSLTWLARTLAADENPTVRNGTEAVELAGLANELTGGEHPFVLDTLAMALAEAGRFEEAQQAARRAIDLAAAGAKEMVPPIQERLRLYEAGKPYRETFTNSHVVVPK